MSLPARAAAIRGDDYQHAIAWYWACEMIRDCTIASVAIEDAAGGAFDDIVVRRKNGPHTYIQAKSSNFGNTVVDQDWLFTARSKKGQSPLQRFYGTCLERAANDEEFTLELWTHRGFDHGNKLLGKLLDKKFDAIDTNAMLAATRRSAIGKERDAWARHLNIDTDELAAFLSHVRWKQTGAEGEWRRQARPLMQLAGLQCGDQAVEVGVSIARHWVTDDAGPQTADDVRAATAKRGLLALTGTLLLVVHGIDHDPTPTPPNVELDFVDLYDGNEPFNRKLLQDRNDWDRVIIPRVQSAARTLASYRTRHVHVAGSMRHPMWFLVGRALPEVKRWTLSADQVGAVWSTADPPSRANVRVLADVELGNDTDIAVGIGLTGNPTDAIVDYIGTSGIPIGRVLVYGPHSEPSSTAVPSGSWAMGWTRGVREEVRTVATAIGTRRLHLFTLCPATVALMLGYQWNVMSATVLYEYVRGTYVPTVTCSGE